MKSRIGQILTIALIVLPGIANATMVGTTGKITRIGTGTGGEGLYVTIDQPLNSICTQKTMAYMATNAAQYKETFSTLLLAMTQGKPITLYYDTGTCSGGGSNGNLVLAAVSIGS